ncbi:MAG: sulfurtransferase [Alcaligenaceae bacterium]|nr:sulfurtransferase [Alcaligenaceae bacterium SAGV5]MPS50930.1 sulfurtransferase [Alcaligenaceae bacterium SAGV3]MPT55748.1 sulfurtransferase [Alcaligenaceae bacterium]
MANERETAPMPSGPLITASDLARVAGGAGVVILDCTSHLPTERRDARREFEAAHIPGARFVDLAEISDPASGLPTMLPPAAQFEAVMRRLGIQAGDLVVAYDTHGIRTAPRLWWMFRGYGHERVAVLDGGLPAWRAAGGVLEQGPAAPAREGGWRATREHDAVADTAATRAAAAHASSQVVDARSAERFRGLAPEPRPGLRAGHIPGSVNLPYEQLLDPVSHAYLPDDRLAEAMRTHGLELGRDTGFVCSCGSGVSACVLALALHKLGERDVRVYDGSWTQWGSDAALPVETGDGHAYALKTYVAAPGKFAAMRDRFLASAAPLLAEQGLLLERSWTPPEAPDTFVYLLKWRPGVDFDRAWDAFARDPRWQEVKRRSEADGPLIARQESMMLGISTGEMR